MEPAPQFEGQLHHGNESPGAVYVRDGRVDILIYNEKTLRRGNNEFRRIYELKLYSSFIL